MELQIGNFLINKKNGKMFLIKEIHNYTAGSIFPDEGRGIALKNCYAKTNRGGWIWKEAYVQQLYRIATEEEIKNYRLIYQKE